MKLSFSRADDTRLSEWYWTIDRWMIGGFLILMIMGAFLVAAASPPVAQRIGLPSFYFVERHVIMQCIGLFLMLGVSILDPRQIRILGLSLFAAAFLLMIATLFIGFEIKGARRWIHVPGLSIQPSEFIKPAFAIVAAWLFARQSEQPSFPGKIINIVLYGLTVTLLLLQPDLGMTVLVTAVWGVQFFLAGLPLVLVASMIVLAVCGLIGAYFTFDHVESRINRFLDPETGGDTYQIEKSIEAFRHGGLLGTGPGQGEVKFHLPDAHADFVFSVAGEELGLVWTLFIVALFLALVIRGFFLVLNVNDVFTVLAVGGLLTQFGLQAIIHMASSLHLMPTKGMTLPFLSYGGSSLLGLSIGMGMVLALTRRTSNPSWGRR